MNRFQAYGMEMGRKWDNKQISINHINQIIFKKQKTKTILNFQETLSFTNNCSTFSHSKIIFSFITEYRTILGLVIIPFKLLCMHFNYVCINDPYFIICFSDLKFDLVSNWYHRLRV